VRQVLQREFQLSVVLSVMAAVPLVVLLMENKFQLRYIQRAGVCQIWRTRGIIGF
jgi:hypothetical protein